MTTVTAKAPEVTRDFERGGQHLVRPEAALAELAPSTLPADHPRVQPKRIGVLLMNLGTPDGTDYRSMRRYLDEFLSDRRVIELSPWLWQPILKLVVLSKRPQRSGHAYASIWNKELDESPLRTVTRSQAEKLAVRLAGRDPRLMVEWGMRYGQPAIASGLEKLAAQGCTRILLLPVYPQYSASTTATGYDKAFSALMKMRWQPAIRTSPPYHDHPAYIAALAESVREHLATLEWEPDRVICSFHGLPQEYLLKGDPYHCQCQKTARLLREELGWGRDRMMLCFQSRFGPKEWLQPYLDKTLEALPGEGVKKVAIISPGFAADCVETLEEINIEGRESFMTAGGEQFSYIPCLNDGPGQMALLEELALGELGGWL